MRHSISALLGIFLFLSVGVNLHAGKNLTEYAKATECLDRKGEVYFSYIVDDISRIREFTDILSIDKVDHTLVYAYANRREFADFLNYNLYYEVLPHPGDLLQNPAMSSDVDEIKQSWNTYPTISGYYDLMDGFESDYPDKCKIIQIGTSGKGRKLLYVKISDNVNEVEAEPRVMLTTSMHGDETTMYVNFLRLADYLLSHYDSDTFVKKLVDNVEIWICPLENPDGTYVNSDNSVSNARRQTSNNIDLNRHYPSFLRGAHPDGASRYEPECQAVLDLLDTCQFVVSMNCHGGYEVLNYPFDSYSTKHPDDAWMRYVYQKYADKVHEVNPNYLTNQNNGIVQGWYWYEIHGSRMDHITWGRFCREVTAELSSQKLMDASRLPDYWDYNYEALLEYIEQSLFGINGTVTCASTGDGLRAKVFVQNHDKDSSFTMSKLPHGDFWRPIYQGTYTLEFSCDGYESKTVSNVQVQNDNATVLHVELDPETSLKDKNSAFSEKSSITVTPGLGGSIAIALHNFYGSSQMAIFDLSGRIIKHIPQQASGTDTFIWDGMDISGKPVSNGCYLVKCTCDNRIYTKNFMLSR